MQLLLQGISLAFGAWQRSGLRRTELFSSKELTRSLKLHLIPESILAHIQVALAIGLF